MCKPLKDIVAEYEGKYQGCTLCTLEERAQYIRDYEASIEHLFKVMDSYVSEVKYTLEHKLSHSVISRITQNLIINMVHTHDVMSPYSTAMAYYLMDERYDQNHKYWEEFNDRANEIVALIEKLHNNNVFCVDNVDKDSYLQNLHVVAGLKRKALLQVKKENTLAISNGAKLLECLYYVIDIMEEDLSAQKTQGLWLGDSILEEFYEINYLIYAKEYWPAVERSFRPHILKYYFKDNVDISELERLKRDQVREFENYTDTGRIWRDYSEDKIQLASKLKEQIKSDNEWQYFFKNIFELEEYDRWIDELRNPPEEKVKAAVLIENKGFMSIMAKAVEQGLCSQQDWQFKWKEKIDAVYFAYIASPKFCPIKRRNRDMKPAISWKPFESLFGEEGFRSVFNDYQNGSYKLHNKERIEKLFR